MVRLPADRPAVVELGERDKLADAFRDYWRYHVTVHDEGQPPLQQQRDILIGYAHSERRR